MSRKKPALPDAPATSSWPWWLAALLVWTAVNVAYIPRVAGVPWAGPLARWLAEPLVGLPQWPAVLAQLKRVVFTAALSFVLAATGRRLLRVLGLRAHNYCEELALSFTLGYGAWATGLLLLGLAGLWRKPFLEALGALGLAWAVFDWRRSAAEPAAASVGSPTSWERWSLGLLLAGWCYVARYSLIPETFYDALQYHLWLPSLYLQHGRILAVPENSYAGIPALPQMLYGLTLAFDRWGVSASLLHASMIWWIALAFIGLAGRLGRPGAGALAAAAFFFAPVVTAECYRTSVGLEWTLLELCFFSAWLAALSKTGDDPERRRWLALAGCLLGLTMAAKYQAWLLPLALLPALLVSPRAKAREIATVLAAAGVMLAPWIIKNIWLYGNPIYPFFQEFFSPNSAFLPDWRQMSSAGAGASVSLLSLQGLQHYAWHPWRFLVSTEDLSLSIGPFALCLLPLVLARGTTEQERLLAWTALCCWVPLSLVSELTRYFIPHLALITLAVACGVSRAEPRALRNAVLLLGVCLFSATGFWWSVFDGNRGKLAVYRGDIGYAQYLEHHEISYPTPAYAGIGYINAATPPSAKVLVYGDPRAFYLERQALAASSDQTEVLEVWANQSADGAALAARLRAAGVDYILINFAEKARTHKIPRLSEAGMKALSDFWRRGVVIEYGERDAGDRWLAVYRVLKADEPPRDNSEDKFIDVLKWLQAKGAQG